MEARILKLESDYAVLALENSETVELPNALIPENSKEGDIIEITSRIKLSKKRQDEIQRIMAGVGD